MNIFLLLRKRDVLIDNIHDSINVAFKGNIKF